MKTFSVNVHFDMVYSCEVKAKTQEEAERKAEQMAECASPEELECTGSNVCSYEIN